MSDKRTVTYYTRDLDVLDMICMSMYESQHPAVELVLDRHYELSGGVSLAEYLEQYTSGILITLPELSREDLEPTTERRISVLTEEYLAAQGGGGKWLFQ